MQSTIRQRVMKVKGRPNKDEIKRVEYNISYECGATYINETGQNLHKQVKGMNGQCVEGTLSCTCNKDET